MAKVTKNDGDGDTNKKQTNTKHQMTRKNKKILLGENGEDTPVRSKQYRFKKVTAQFWAKHDDKRILKRDLILKLFSDTFNNPLPYNQENFGDIGI